MKSVIEQSDGERFISKKILTYYGDMKLIVKTVKVSDKGQIAIPTDIREKAGIARGDTLIIIQDAGKILIEKESEKLLDDFSDLLKNSESVAKELWENKHDEIWDKI